METVMSNEAVAVLSPTSGYKHILSLGLELLWLGRTLYLWGRDTRE